MATEENPHAGQGAVLLDIGGDVGALVVICPPEMDGVEVDIVPAGTPPHGSAEPEDHAHAAGHGHGHGHGHGAPPHVAVVARPIGGGQVLHSLVYPELTEGEYDLAIKPDGPVALTATVHGGKVTETTWPAPAVG